MSDKNQQDDGKKPAPEAGTNGQPASPDPANAGPEADSGDDDQDDLQQTFAREYVVNLRKEAEAYRKKAKALQDQLDRTNNEAEEKRRKELEDTEQFKQLYQDSQTQIEQLTAVKKDYEKLIEKITDRNKTRVEALPEYYRSMVPDFSDPLQLEGWLDANETKLKEAKAGPNGIPPTPPGEDGKLSDEEKRKRSTSTF